VKLKNVICGKEFCAFSEMGVGTFGRRFGEERRRFTLSWGRGRTSSNFTELPMIGLVLNLKFTSGFSI
jgi:hypothetical protein